MHNVVLYERLVNGWGLSLMLILYLIRALGNSMEARFRHWLKIKKVIATFYLTILIFFFLKLRDINSQLRD